jgi:hypothetical protein
MAIKGSLATAIRSTRVQMPGFFQGEARRASKLVAIEVKRRTPVGKEIDPSTGNVLGISGHLKRSVDELVPVEIAPGIWRAGAESNVQYASYIERGTRARIIHGNTHLRFWNFGKLIYARKVSHPGNRGVHMFMRGLNAAERTFRVTSNAQLQGFLSKNVR